MAGSTQSKQWRIELLYRHKRETTNRIIVLNIQKLYLYFVYFKLHVYFEWSPPARPLKKMMRAQHLESRLLQIFSKWHFSTVK